MVRLSSLLEQSVQLGRRGVVETRAVLLARRAGMIGGDSPKDVVAMLRALDKLGQLGGAIAIAAIRHRDRVGLTDELGSLTFSELDARSNALACALRARGVGEGAGVG